MPRPLDDLTGREREVLDLVRLGLTNEEIANRLGITVSGAKYHVSQILSKLGVATRDEAAVWPAEARRRWWARWPLWAKIAAAATATAAVAGVAALVWSAAPTEQEAEDDRAARVTTVEDLYDAVEQVITRPGFVLHSSVELHEADESGVPMGEPGGVFEFWIDASNERMRYHLQTFGSTQVSEGSEDVLALFVGGSVYTRTESGEVTKADAPQNRCPETDDLLLSFFLLCFKPAEEGRFDARVENGRLYDGRSTLALLVDESYVTTLPGGPLPYATGTTLQPTVSATSFETRNTSRTHLDPETLLPIARTYEIRQDGQFHDASAWLYQNEYIPADDLDADFFDPGSLGRVVRPSPTPAGPVSTPPGPAVTPIASGAQ
jgi:DNA-binding CsgD family transcriptional regulator